MLYAIGINQMYFSIPNSILILCILLILYGLGVVMSSSLLTLLFNKIIKVKNRIDVVKLLKTSFVGLGLSLFVGISVSIMKGFFFKEIDFFYTEYLFTDLFTLLFLYLPMITSLGFAMRSVLKQI